jgi:hypothetical protein
MVRFGHEPPDASSFTRRPVEGTDGMVIPSKTCSMFTNNRGDWSDRGAYWDRIAFVLSPGVHCSGDGHFRYKSVGQSVCRSRKYGSPVTAKQSEVYMNM